MNINFEILKNNAFTSNTNNDVSVSKLQEDNNYLLNIEGTPEDIVDEYNVRGFIENNKNQYAVRGFFSFITSSTIMNESYISSNGTDFKPTPYFKGIYYNDKKLADLFNQYYNNNILRGVQNNQQYITNQITNFDDNNFEYKLQNTFDNNFHWLNPATSFQKQLNYIPLDISNSIRKGDVEKKMVVKPRGENYFLNVILLRTTTQTSRGIFDLCENKIYKNFSALSEYDGNYDVGTLNINDAINNNLTNTVQINNSITNNFLEITDDDSLSNDEKILKDIEDNFNFNNVKTKNFVDIDEKHFSDEEISEILKQISEKLKRKINTEEKNIIENNINLIKKNVVLENGFEKNIYKTEPLDIDTIKSNFELFDNSYLKNEIENLTLESNSSKLNNVTQEGLEDELELEKNPGFDNIIEDKKMYVNCFVDLNIKTNENEIYSSKIRKISFEKLYMNIGDSNSYAIKVLLDNPAIGNEKFKIKWNFTSALLPLNFQFGVPENLEKTYNFSNGQQYKILTPFKINNLPEDLLFSFNIKIKDLFNLEYGKYDTLNFLVKKNY